MRPKSPLAKPKPKAVQPKSPKLPPKNPKLPLKHSVQAKPRPASETAQAPMPGSEAQKRSFQELFASLERQVTKKAEAKAQRREPIDKELKVKIEPEVLSTFKAPSQALALSVAQAVPKSISPSFSVASQAPMPTGAPGLPHKHAVQQDAVKVEIPGVPVLATEEVLLLDVLPSCAAPVLPRP